MSEPPSPYGYTATITGILIAASCACYFNPLSRSRQRLERAVALLTVGALVVSLPIQIGMARGWERAHGGHSTPAPVESVPVCGPDQIGPYRIEGRLMCIPQDQGG